MGLSDTITGPDLPRTDLARSDGPPLVITVVWLGATMQGTSRGHRLALCLLDPCQSSGSRASSMYVTRSYSRGHKLTALKGAPFEQVLHGYPGLASGVCHGLCS